MTYPAEIVNQATANVIEGARSKRRLSQKAFAAAAGMSTVTVQKLLTGNQSMKIPQFIQLAIACEREPGALLDEVVATAEELSVAASMKNDIEEYKKSRRPQTASDVDETTEDRAALSLDPEATEPDAD